MTRPPTPTGGARPPEVARLTLSRAPYTSPQVAPGSTVAVLFLLTVVEFIRARLIVTPLVMSLAPANGIWPPLWMRDTPVCLEPPSALTMADTSAADRGVTIHEGDSLAL